ncbi:hypothetical protein GKZ68_10650 [Hymenobacter sp. BRD128]|uniref:hypothetical protein n=1 Tax=Hymenobacter sp. BRD128 TaxID=2675878 RepID=UPI00156764D3|nr:hypothetical protein [Hymenobacter sp. BRD128]QKG57047.1 hypothetical protein GKZ68_10650 [Hymenobacter sp. BRD128]
MALYLSPLELTARLHLGKEVHQWLGYFAEDDYIVLRWLYIAKNKQQYTVCYVESFDEGDEEWTDVTEFSHLDPDEAIEHSFASVEEAVEFAIQTYAGSREGFIPGGLLHAEYLAYWRSKNGPK